MRFYLLLLALAVYDTAFGQTKEKYYDINWEETSLKKATFYSIQTKTDSGWLQTDFYIRAKQLQMSALYSDEACKIGNGNFYFYYPNGRPLSLGRMIDNKKEAYAFVVMSTV